MKAFNLNGDPEDHTEERAGWRWTGAGVGRRIVTLDANRLCTEFREWWNSRTRPA